MAEHSAVNRRVVSSSLTCGANKINKLACQQTDRLLYFPKKFPNAELVILFTMLFLKLARSVKTLAISFLTPFKVRNQVLSFRI